MIMRWLGHAPVASGLCLARLGALLACEGPRWGRSVEARPYRDR